MAPKKVEGRNLAKAQSVRYGAAGVSASPPDRRNGSNELSRASGGARVAARPSRKAAVKAVIGISESMVQEAEDVGVVVQERASSPEQSPVRSRNGSNEPLHAARGAPAAAPAAVKARDQADEDDDADKEPVNYVDCPVDGCDDVFDFTDKKNGKRLLSLHCRSGHKSHRWTPKEDAVLKRYDIIRCSKCGVALAKVSRSRHRCSAPSAVSPALSRSSSATLTQRSAAAPAAAAASMVRADSKAKDVALPSGLREDKEEHSLGRSDSTATLVLDEKSDGAEQKYPAAAADVEVHPKLRRRVRTYARLPRALWGVWRDYVGTICAEMQRAREMDEMDALFVAAERLLDAPCEMLQRAGGVDQVRERYKKWRRVGNDEDGKEDKKADDDGDLMRPMQTGEKQRSGNGCFLVPPELLQQTDDPKARRVQNILRTGAPKAMRKAASAALQDSTVEHNEAVYEALRPLHPRRDQSVRLPVCPVNFNDPSPVIDDESMVRIVNGYRGAAPGPSNWTADLLMILLDVNEIRHTFTAFLTDIAAGKYDPSSVGSRLRACALVGLVKDEVLRKFRPVAMGELFLKVAAACIIDAEKDKIAEIFQLSVQFGVGRKGGCESASIVANAALNGNNKTGAVFLDQGNAYNQIPRELVMRELYARPQLQRLWKVADFAYGTPSPLLMYGRNGELVSNKIYCSEQGVRQGCALGGLLYANAVHSLYTEALAAAGEGQVSVIAVMDDVGVIGEIGAVRRVVAAFKVGSAKRGLELNVDKSIVLQPKDPSVAGEWQSFAQQNAFQKPRTGAVEWLGTAIGYDGVAMAKIITEINNDQHDKLFQLVKSTGLGAQNALLLLRSSILPRATYAMRTASPGHVEDFTSRFDAQVLCAMASIVQRKMPSDGSSVFGPSGESFRLSLSRGGVGLRAAEQLNAAAYISAVAVAISYMTEQQRETLKRDDNMAGAGLRVAVTKLRLSAPNFLYVHSQDPKHPYTQRECKTTVQFVDHYSEVSAIGMPIQRLLSKAMEKYKFGELCGDPKTKARLLSAGAKTAYQWITTLPTEHQLCMSDVEVVRALRHRIGIAPIDTMQRCGCGVVVNDHNFDHFHSCELVKSAATKARHDTVLQALAVVATQAGVTTKMEYGSSAAKEKFGSRKNPDGVLFGLHATGADVVTDVCVANPTSDSRVARTSAAVGKLATASSEENVKYTKYSDFIVQHRSVFCAFVSESYGAFGKSMQAIIAALTRRANQRTVPSTVDLTAFSFAQWAVRVLAVAIQRGNSRVVDVAAQRMRKRAGR